MLTRAIPVLRSAESRRAEAFYVRLGFRLASAWRPDPARADPCYMAFVRDGVAVHVSSFPGDGVAGGGAMFFGDAVDALHAEFVAAGVAIAMPPTDQDWGNREFYVRDPDGNRLCFAMPRVR